MLESETKRENARKSQQVKALTKGHLNSKRQLFFLLTDAARPAEIFQHFLCSDTGINTEHRN